MTPQTTSGFLKRLDIVWPDQRSTKQAALSPLFPGRILPRLQAWQLENDLDDRRHLPYGTARWCPFDINFISLQTLARARDLVQNVSAVWDRLSRVSLTSGQSGPVRVCFDWIERCITAYGNTLDR